MSFIYNMADTWNAIGTTFNSIYMSISDGAGGAPVGAAASRMFRLDSNSTKIFDVSISNKASLGNLTADPFTRGYTGAILGVAHSTGNSAIEINSSTGNNAFLDMGVNASRIFSISSGATGTFVGTIGATPLQLGTGSTTRINCIETGTVTVGISAIATNATDGFLYVPVCAGAPTGVPTTQAGFVPFVFDSTNSQLWFYTGGAWKQPKTPAAAAIVTFQ